jgi:hypothetical protein
MTRCSARPSLPTVRGLALAHPDLPSGGCRGSHRLERFSFDDVREPKAGQRETKESRVSVRLSHSPTTGIGPVP